VLPQGLRRGQVNFRSHNSCLPLGRSSLGRRRACVLFGISFRGRYSLTGLPGDTVWLNLPPTGWGWLGVLTQMWRCGSGSRLAPMMYRALPTDTSQRNPRTRQSLLHSPHQRRPHSSHYSPNSARESPHHAFAALLFACIDGHGTGYYRGSLGSMGLYRRAHRDMGQYGAVRGSTVEMGALQGTSKEK